MCHVSCTENTLMNDRLLVAGQPQGAGREIALCLYLLPECFQASPAFGYKGGQMHCQNSNFSLCPSLILQDVISGSSWSLTGLFFGLGLCAVLCTQIYSWTVVPLCSLGWSWLLPGWCSPGWPMFQVSPLFLSQAEPLCFGVRGENIARFSFARFHHPGMGQCGWAPVCHVSQSWENCSSSFCRTWPQAHGASPGSNISNKHCKVFLADIILFK
jgi:hypothetical protein